MWTEGDLREIRAFLVLSEELHFARTAERLGVTSSRVGQLIRTLETRVGGKLFERASRRVRLRLPLNQPDITSGPVLSHEERVLMIARDDPLAAKQAVSIEDFADRPVTGGAASHPSEMVDALVPLVSPSGRRVLRVSPTSIEEMQLRVARGEQVHATVRSVADHLVNPNITFVPITDLPPSETALAWLTANRTARTEAFARDAADVLEGTELAAYQPANPAVKTREHRDTPSGA